LPIYRIAGFEDGYFPFFAKNLRLKTIIVGSFFKGLSLDYVSYAWVTVDGLDSTEKILAITRSFSKHSPVDAIMLSSLSYAGFNVVDPFKLREELDVPVIIVTKKRPEINGVERALKRHFEDWEVRLRPFIKLSEATEPVLVKKGDAKYYVQTIGYPIDRAVKTCISTTTLGGLPEPLRIAKLIASAASKLYYKLMFPKYLGTLE